MTTTALAGSITFSQRADTLVVSMIGDIDWTVITDEDITTLADLAATANRVDIDLTRTTFLDSTTLGFLIIACDAGTVRPLLIGASSSVRRLLEVSGMASLFFYVDIAGIGS